ncbi:two-component system regulatory protein YycI [Bacillus salitolerans]|uniref:Two-component system regulatory protein YycI n=1 Tax=Bacillus salitolerans TaxID=1437434 RepID=A0ABW4LI87_9BACI
MDWSKTKTIFIIVFLILDLFLAFQFVEKRDQNQLGIIAETTLEDQLEANEISYVDLPKETIKETYITGKSKEFIANEVEALQGQIPEIINNTKLESVFETPVPIEEETAEWLNTFVKNHVLEGGSYMFWGYEEQHKLLLFFQHYNGKPVYYNQNALLAIHVNEENEMIGYEQTLLVDIEEMMVGGNKQEILPPIKAIENMYKRNDLKPGSKVTKVELGYFTLVPDAQVFVPTWHFIVNNKENFFINAFEGQIIRDNTQWSEVE